MKEIKKGRITMMFRKGSFKKGFTLSEVLITIAIVGALATMTIGVIRVNTDRQFSAGRSIFRSDIATALALMNAEESLSKYAGKDKTSFFSALADKFNVVRMYNEDSKGEIFALDKMKDKAGNEVELSKYNHYFVTKNGVSVAMSYVNSDIDVPKFIPDSSVISTSGKDFEMSNKALNFVTGVYDLNGKKGPNVVGKDIGLIMPAYRLNEKAGEYFTMNNDGSFSVVANGTSKPIIDSDGNKVPDGDPGEPGGYVPSGFIDDDPDDDPDNNPDNKCTLFESACATRGLSFNKEACACECNISCPSGQVLDKQNCICKEDIPICPVGSVFNCVASGGDWDNINQRCDCAQIDQTTYKNSACGFKGYVPSGPTCNICVKSCHRYNKDEVNTKANYAKSTYYHSEADSFENECFKCVQDFKNQTVTTKFDGTNEIQTSQKPIILQKLTTKGKCGCEASCNNGGDYTASSTVSFGAITNDSTKACKWNCNPGEKPSQYHVLIGLTNDANNSCRWKWNCDTPNGTKHSGNPNWVFVNDPDRGICEYQCTKPAANPPAKRTTPIWGTDWWPGYGIVDYKSTWIAGNASDKNNTCKWSYACDFDNIDKTYKTSEADCSWWKECPITDCNSMAQSCIKLTNNSNCPRLNEAYQSFVAQASSTTTWHYGRCNPATYNPRGTGFNMTMNCDSSTKGVYSTNDRGKNKIYASTTTPGTCDVSQTVTKTATLDPHTCKCVGTITQTTTNMIAAGTEHVYAYEGWDHIGVNGSMVYDNWKSYRCKYTHSSSAGAWISGTYGSYNCGNIFKDSINGNNYISSISESCTTHDDPIVLIFNGNKTTSDLVSQFNTDKKLNLDDNESITWMADNQAENLHYMYLVKTINADNQEVSMPEEGQSLTGGWGYIKDLMFTDMGYNHGLDELQQYTNTELIDGTTYGYVNELSDNWNNLRLLAIDTNNGVPSNVVVKTLDEMNVIEIALHSYRDTGAERENTAGAIGALEGCFRTGIKATPGDDDYIRTVTNGQIKYCKKGNEKECVNETISGFEKYSFENGKCELITTPSNKYFKGADGNYYKEVARPLADILFKNTSN